MENQFQRRVVVKTRYMRNLESNGGDVLLILVHKSVALSASELLIAMPSEEFVRDSIILHEVVFFRAA